MGYSATTEPAPTGHHIHELVQAVHAARSPTTLESLWRAVFALDSWHLLVKGAPPIVRPTFTRIDDHALLLLFTTASGARDYLERRARRELDADGVLEMTPAAVMELLPPAVDAGIYGVLFNEPKHGFYAPLPSLLDMHEYFSGRGGRGPSCFCGVRGLDFDALVRRIGSTPESPSREVLRALARLPDWWFVCNPQNTDAVAVTLYRGAPAVLAFTDDWQALRGIERFSLAGDGDEVVLLQLGAKEAISWLPNFGSENIHHVIFNAAGESVVLPVERIADLGRLRTRSP